MPRDARILVSSIAFASAATALVSLMSCSRGEKGGVVQRPEQWHATSAEYRALALQTYATAARELDKLAAGREPGTWAVIMDADETLLSNIEYYYTRSAEGRNAGLMGWSDSVNEADLPMVPGAEAFAKKVNELGGRLIVVTNRPTWLANETEENLERHGIKVDKVLAKNPASKADTKDSRFLKVQNGEADDDLPPLEVLMWFGDRIHDFPGGTEEWRNAEASALEPFGTRWFMLPNVLYGDWVENAPPEYAPPGAEVEDAPAAPEEAAGPLVEETSTEEPAEVQPEEPALDSASVEPQPATP